MNTNTLQMVEQLVDRLTTDEQITLIEHLAIRLRKTIHSEPPKPLYGIWRDKFPADLDIDSALKQIRHGWELEWEANPKA
jgi:hypothetical protein